MDDKAAINEFFQNLYNTGFRNKMFYSRPISESKEDAMMDMHVEEFLKNSYQASGDEDEEFLDLFTERLYGRIFEQ
tara:strand:+ start:271 stop:498 length:228 start_codon:yes stop_codon:yes gene_type:complete